MADSTTVHVTGRAASLLHDVQEQLDRAKKRASSLLEKNKESIDFGVGRATVAASAATLGFIAGRYEERWEKGAFGVSAEGVAAGLCYAGAMVVGGDAAKYLTHAGDAALAIAIYDEAKQKGKDSSAGPLASAGPLDGAQGHRGLSQADEDFLNDCVRPR